MFPGDIKWHLLFVIRLLLAGNPGKLPAFQLATHVPSHIKNKQKMQKGKMNLIQFDQTGKKQIVSLGLIEVVIICRNPGDTHM